MQVFLDDHPLDLNPAEPVTFAAAVRAAIDEATRQGRIIIEGTRAGSPLSDTLLAEPPETPFDGELRLVSIDPREMVRTSLEHAARALVDNEPAQLQIAHEIQAGRVEVGLADLKKVIETWQAVTSTIEQCHQMLRLPATGGHGLDVRSPQAPSTAARFNPTDLPSILTAMAREIESLQSALTREDWAAVSDLFAYELPPRQRERAEAIRTIAQRITSPR